MEIPIAVMISNQFRKKLSSSARQKQPEDFLQDPEHASSHPSKNKTTTGDEATTGFALLKGKTFLTSTAAES